MSKSKENLKVETFRLNRDIDSDKQLIAFLERSSNKTGLVKDALHMYRTLVESGAYSSPYIEGSEPNWRMIFSNLDPSSILVGGRPTTAKEEVKKELIASMSQPAKAVEPTVEDDEDFEGNDDNDLDF